jgi:hypothetical protein
LIFSGNEVRCWRQASAETIEPKDRNNQKEQDTLMALAATLVLTAVFRPKVETERKHWRKADKCDPNANQKIERVSANLHSV